MNIPNPNKKNYKFINNEVALNPNKSDPEASPFLISFQYYNNQLCEIESLVKNNGKRLLMDIKTIGQSTIKTLASKNIGMNRVINSGEYSKLFNKLPVDVDQMYEHKGNGSNRLFYFIVDSRLIYIVVILNSHLETNKNRR